MIYATLEFYLNNKANYELISQKKKKDKNIIEEDFKDDLVKSPEGVKRKKKLPSWMSKFGIGNEFNSNEYQREAKELADDFKKKEYNWKEITQSRPSKAFSSGKYVKSLKRVNLDKKAPQKRKFVSIKRLKGNPNRQLKIIYASRTHSQISEFIKELKTICRLNQLSPRIVHLGSRKLFCQNKNINQKKASEFFNEMCRKQRESKSCKYYNFNKMFNFPPNAMVNYFT